jgi:hypothetical protein
VIVTVGAVPRLTVTVAGVPVPKALVQITVMVFAPRLSGTVAGLVAELPFSVQAIGAVPLEVQATLVDVAVVLLPLAGEVIVTVGAPPLFTVTTLLSLPNALVQVTVMMFAPLLSGTFAGLVAALPLTVQEIGVEPVVVQETLIDPAVVLVPSAGEVIVTLGAVPRLTVTVAGVLVPNALVQDAVMAFAPTLSATEFVEVLVELLPLTVQVVPPGIEVPPSTV